MRWLIDGYNVVRRDAGLHDRDAQSLQAGRAALLAVVARVASRVSDTFTVVFDGTATGATPPAGGRVQVVFSRSPETADDVLRRLVGTLREGAVVVSSDRAVQQSAHRAGAVAISAEAFMDAARGDGDDVGDTDEDDAATPGHGGPSRRQSKEARAAQRVLRRLRGR